MVFLQQTVRAAQVFTQFTSPMEPIPFPRSLHEFASDAVDGEGEVLNTACIDPDEHCPVNDENDEEFEKVDSAELANQAEQFRKFSPPHKEDDDG